MSIGMRPRRGQKLERELPPLENGDRLDQKTFHERYEAMPENVRAELIGGIVYLASPLKPRHGRSGADSTWWISHYSVATPGTDNVQNTTQILGPDSEPMPDDCLFILPEYGGQVEEGEDGYFNGPPDFISEISESSESIDLHGKKADYEKAGVREYMVAALRREQVFWFVRKRGKFKEIAADADGIFRSQIFPGLWLDPVALVRRNRKRVLAVLEQGLASPEHAEFVKKLDRAREKLGRVA
jgi:Uma2 family endonuclease